MQDPGLFRVLATFHCLMSSTFGLSCNPKKRPESGHCTCAGLTVEGVGTVTVVIFL